jgi:trans-2-enoyl-CoA reductase
VQTGNPAVVLEYCSSAISTHPDNNKAMVRVDMLAAPWNPADAMSVAGRYPSPYGFGSTDGYTTAKLAQRSLINDSLHQVAGSEGWGRVAATQGDSELQVGDFVVPGMPGLGTCRSSLLVPTGSLVKVQRGEELFDKVGDVAVAPLFQTAGTAWNMLFANRSSSLKPGDVVVQNAGNSAVGIMVHQLVAAAGARCISLVRRHNRTSEQVDAMMESLMHYNSSRSDELVVVTEEENDKESVEKLLDELGMRRPTLALNAVGGPSAGLLLNLLEDGGTMVTYGGMSKQPVTVPTSHFIFRDIRTTGYWHGRWMAQESTDGERSQLMNTLVDMVLDGKLICPPATSFALSEFKEAFAFEASQSDEAIRRKVVFDCQEQST